MTEQTFRINKYTFTIDTEGTLHMQIYNQHRLTKEETVALWECADAIKVILTAE